MATRVLSIRIDPDLLEAVRDRARLERRSVSGEIVQILRDRVGPTPEVPQKSLPIMGWRVKLRRGVPKTFEEFRAARDEVSAELLRSVDRKARRL